MNASQGEFRALVNAALFTGCRYGELGRLHVGDVNADAGTIFVGKSKSGKARHVVLTEEGQGFFRQLTAGRASNALLLAKVMPRNNCFMLGLGSDAVRWCNSILDGIHRRRC